MELKTYQKEVIKNLQTYLDFLEETQDADTAYYRLWQCQNVPVNLMGGMQPYQELIKNVPDVCFKVPTGGGKTFIGVNSIKVIFDHTPAHKMKAVVWLVPSEAILTQTLKAFTNPDHPYRQKLNADFGGRVNVLTKQELLAGKDFNLSTVAENLTLMVLSYDSFRGRKEALKAKQENSNLAEMARQLGKPENPVEDADETALIQVINQLSPVVIVDESHHARSNLSKKMLESFNPSFVLDLTATPTDESNIISFTDAALLKREHMVKLPVFVYNRGDQEEVITTAIDLRNRLEKAAIEEHKAGGSYIRPIVLFQAQPKNKENSTTFEKLKDQLVDVGIAREEIAIKTAEINELGDTDLQDESCPIRYIITVNALKEGWDCPFAYVLASLANRSSHVEVEQIVGRILRQPYAKDHQHRELNMSYVLTSSSDFKATLDEIVKGLNTAGFSAKDCRLVSQDKAEKKTDYTQEIFTPGVHEGSGYYGGDSDSKSGSQGEGEVKAEKPEGVDEDYLQFNPENVRNLLEKSKVQEQAGSDDRNAGARKVLEEAGRQQEQYDQQIAEQGNDPYQDVPDEIKEKMNMYSMNAEFEEEASKLLIPCFVMHVPASQWMPETNTLLSKENLTENFTLKGKPYPTEFSVSSVHDRVKIDVMGTKESVPKISELSATDKRYMDEVFSKLPDEQKLKTSIDIVVKRVSKLDEVSDREIREYVNLIVDSMNPATKQQMIDNPLSFGNSIKKYIETLLDEARQKQFYEWLETGKVMTQPMYQLPKQIGPLNATSVLGKSLYEAEEEVNDFEYKMAMALTGLDNVKWWHRNISGVGFCLNGFIRHFPDFMVQTESGKIVLIETKGDHLANEESGDKIALGRAWEKSAGAGYKYFMVFESKDVKTEGAYPFDKFLGIMKEL